MALGNGLGFATELKHVTVRLGSTDTATDQLIFSASTRDFTRDEGLDVSVLEGHGFTSSMQLVANKEDTFAIVDPPSLMLAIAQGIPLRMVTQI